MNLFPIFLLNSYFIYYHVGSKAPAANGQLIFLCAGSKDLFNEIENNGLNAMGKASHYFNETVGYGTRAKLVVNSLMGTMVAAFGEAIALAENTGLDPLKMIEVIGQGAIAVSLIWFVYLFDSDALYLLKILF